MKKLTREEKSNYHTALDRVEHNYKTRTRTEDKDLKICLNTLNKLIG